MKTPLSSPFVFLACALLAWSGVVPQATAQTPTPASHPGAESHVYRALEPEPVRLHVHKPADWAPGDRRPALVWFFGGGFLRGTTAQSIGRARWAAREGMVGIAPDYRTRERFGTTADACVADARAALRWIQDHAEELGIDPERIVVGGGSAGGHLALWTALSTTPPRSDPAEAPLFKPAGLILVSPAADTSPTSGLRGDRFGGNSEAFSPLHHLDEKMPPTLIYHGDADTVVPYAHAVALDRALTASGNRSRFITVPGGSHSFSTEQPEWRARVQSDTAEFIRELGLLPVNPR